MTKGINVVFMGGFTYPHGMAGTKRVQNAINALKEYPGITIRVILQRQSTEHNPLSGVHEGTPYETVMGDVLRAKMLAALPALYYKSCVALRRAFRPDHKNMIYFYGYLFLESIVPLGYARKLGYKVVIDVIEDYDRPEDISFSSYGYVKGVLAGWLSSKIKDLSVGIIVISSRLENKYRTYTRGRVPIHYMPVSVDMGRFPNKTNGMKSGVYLFYAGSFSKKDGIPVLLDAFERLAEKYRNCYLVLTGQGDREAMKEFFSRQQASPYRDRIEYKGYLEDKDYFSLLNASDIPCMTRLDLEYAHAGFPFKLGEFLATGKPVIATRVSDVEKFLVHGQNAMLVRPGSSAEICQAAEFLIDNPESAATIGRRGREVAKTFFDYRQQGKALLTFLENL